MPATPQSPRCRGAPTPRRDDFLTGDLNVVTAQAIVQYRVLDPVRLPVRRPLGRRDPGGGRRDGADAGPGRAVDRRRADDRPGRGRRADAPALQERGRPSGAGRLDPGGPARPGGAAGAGGPGVCRRRPGAERPPPGRHPGRGVSRPCPADAQSQAREIADRAAGQFDRLVQGARGEADRFTKVLAESRKAARATRRRLYLEALAELLPRFARKVVVAPGHDLDISLFTDEAGPRDQEAQP